MRTPSRPNSSRGFSLVEMLVAVAIAGILVALLAPALSGIRRKADLSAASANIRQILAAFNLYAGENNGLYPPVGTNKEVNRLQAIWDEKYVGDPRVYINPINKKLGSPVGSIYLGGGKYAQCFFGANEKIYTNWTVSGGAATTPLRVTEPPVTPIVWDQRADRLWANNFVTLPDGNPGGLFGYPDGAVLLLGQKNNVIRSNDSR